MLQPEMMRPTMNPEDMDAYEPLPAWRGMVRYYGELVRRPGWERMYPLFDLVKQISTSLISVEYTPSLEGDALVLTRTPSDSPPDSAAGPASVPSARLLITATPERELLFEQYLPGESEPRWLRCSHEQAFNTLSRIVTTM